MKTTPQQSQNSQQKKTKLTKVAWRAEVCDAVHNRSVTGSQELAPPFTRLFASFVTFCFILAGFSLVCASSLGQTPDSVAEREVQRRQAGITQGEAALARGQAAMRAKDYGAAHEEFRTAITYLPDAVVSGKAHDEAAEGFCKSGVVLAEARIAEGRYADAEAILSEILSDRYDPKSDPKNATWFAIDIRGIERFPRVVPIAELRDKPELEGMALLQKGSRLSVQRVRSAEWNAVVSAAKPWIGCNFTTRCPSVRMIRQPPAAVPTAMVAAQRIFTQSGMAKTGVRKNSSHAGR